jgi:3-mercaptopropionate dioxygenase
MSRAALDRFIAQASACTRDLPEPADCVQRIAPLMFDLIEHAAGFLEPWHTRGAPEHYTRNLVFDAAEAGLSLYALVWLPGQWTPVHDHGSWGVVGVLEERSFVRVSADRGADAGIDLVRGGVVLLARGAVTSFVPNPDHIHIAGVPAERPGALSLHLYGRTMSHFNTYDLTAGTRRRVDVDHKLS